MIDGDGCGTISGMNEWQGKPKYLEETCRSADLSTTDPTWPDPGSNQGRHAVKLATNRLSYSTAYWIIQNGPVKRKQRNKFQNNDWLWAGWLWGQSSSACSVKKFHFTILSKLAVAPNQPHIHWVPRAFPPGAERQRREADNSPQLVQRLENEDICIHSHHYIFMM
jgi:hypothetical protein